LRDFSIILAAATVVVAFGAEWLGGRLLPRAGFSFVEVAFAAIPLLLMTLWIVDLGFLVYFILVGGLGTVVALVYVMFVAGLFPVRAIRVVVH
jgi:hypothetical protein